MTDKQKANREELAVSAIKRIWIKPTIEIISVETGTASGKHERSAATPFSISHYHS